MRSFDFGREYGVVAMAKLGGRYERYTFVTSLTIRATMEESVELNWTLLRER